MSNYGPIHTDPHGDYEFTCVGCGTIFRTDHPRQEYCSNPCKRHCQNRRNYRRRRFRQQVMDYADEITDQGRNDPAW